MILEEIIILKANGGGFLEVVVFNHNQISVKRKVDNFFQCQRINMLFLFFSLHNIHNVIC